MSTSINFKAGEHVLFNGKSAIVKESHSYSEFVTVVVDGKEYTVNKNDLFGMNNSKNDYFFDRQISAYDKQIQQNKEIISEQNTLWALASAKIKNCRQQMASILRSAGVSVASKIDDETQKAQYYALRDNRRDARSVQIRATSEIISASNSTASAALGKMNVTNQKALFGLV